MNTRIATLKTLNICIKAQKVLEQHGYIAKIVSIDPALTRFGCAYGIEFYSQIEREVLSILKRNGIRPSQILSGGGKLL